MANLGWSPSFNDYEWTGWNNQNIVASELVTMPESGTINSISFFTGGANGDTIIGIAGALWDGAGNLMAATGKGNVGPNAQWITWGLSIHVTAGYQFRMGWWRNPNQGNDNIWYFQSGVGTFYTATTPYQGPTSGPGFSPNSGQIGIFVSYTPDPPPGEPHYVSSNLNDSTSLTGAPVLAAIQVGKTASHVSTIQETSAAIPITATTNGSLLLAFISQPGTAGISSITDTAGNVWSKQTQVNPLTDGELWAVVDGASVTSVTVHLSAAGTMAVQIVELVGGGNIEQTLTDNGIGIRGDTGILTSKFNLDMALGMVQWKTSELIAPPGLTSNYGWVELGQQTCTVAGAQVSQNVGWKWLENPPEDVDFGPAISPHANPWVSILVVVSPVGAQPRNILVNANLSSNTGSFIGPVVLQPFPGIAPWIPGGQPPQLQLVVAGNDLSGYMTHDNWTVMQQLSQQGSTAQFLLVDEHPGDTEIPVSLSFVVKPMDTVQLVDWRLGGRVIFGGVVNIPEIDWQGPNLAQWTLYCVDYTTLADNSNVQGEFLSMTADSVIKDLVGQSGSGITTNHVYPGPLLERVVVSEQSLSSALGVVSEFATATMQFGNNFDWFIDEDGDLWWFSPSQIAPSGVEFSDNPDPSFGHYDNTLQYRWDASSIANSATVIGGSYLRPQTDVWVSDGQSDSYILTFEPDSQSADFTLKVGSTNTTVGFDNGGTPTTQYIVTQGAGFWYLQTGLASSAASGTILTLDYQYQQPILTRVDAVNSQQQFVSLPNKGVFQTLIQDSSLMTPQAARFSGLTTLSEFSAPSEHVIFTTTEEWPGHVRVGDIVKWDSLVVPDSQNSYQPGLSAFFIIISNMITGQIGKFRTYQIEAIRVSSPLAEQTLLIWGKSTWGASTYT